MLSFNSQTSVTVSQGKDSTVYDKWIVVRAQVSIVGNKANLSFSFARYNDTAGILPGSTVNMKIEDVVNDKDMAVATGAFFQALVQKAVAGNVIS